MAREAIPSVAGTSKTIGHKCPSPSSQAIYRDPHFRSGRAISATNSSRLGSNDDALDLVASKGVLYQDCVSGTCRSSGSRASFQRSRIPLGDAVPFYNLWNLDKICGMTSQIDTFQFVDSDPVRGSTRHHELIWSEARSHAARLNLARSRRQAHQHDDDDPASAGSKPALDSPTHSTIDSVRSTALASPASKTSSEGLPERSAQSLVKRFNQKNVPFHRFRVGAYQATRNPTKIVNGSAKKAEQQRDFESAAQQIVVCSFVRTLAGNSDPFNATVVRLTPAEHILLQQARDQLISSVWPAEIAIRQNKAALVHSFWEIVPPTLHDESANYALVAQSYYSRAMRQHAAGLPHDKDLLHAEKYKGRALRGLQELLELNRQSPGDRARLRDMFLACNWLVSCELLCRNWDAAGMHFKATEKIVQISGGWGAFSRMERETLVTAACLMASVKRSRPVIEIDDFDPGHWHEYKFLKPHSPDGLELDIRLTALAPSRLAPSAITCRLKRFFDDFRELLAIEELKLQYASSKKPNALRMFRWSHARRTVVRGRSLHYWCDLLDEAKASGSTIVSLPKGTPLAITFDFALCIAMRCFDRCIFDDHYLPGGILPGGVHAESKRCHLDLLSVVQLLWPVSDEFSLVPGRHTFDVLWICGIGAYVEDVFMRPEQGNKGPIVGLTLPAFAKQFFSTRFSYLVAANFPFTRFDDISRFLCENYLHCPRLQDESLRKLVGSGWTKL